MCLLAIAHRVRRDLPVVLVANRDEMHARPTAPMHWWSTPSLLAGRDLTAGGTWFAVDARGRFAVVTNLRGAPVPPAAPSRGELVPNFVAGNASPGDFLAGLATDAARYAGFNLLVGDHSGIAWLSNGDARPARLLPTGIHALSNGAPGASWPKVRIARERLAAALEADGPTDAGLTAVLAPRLPAPDSELPDTGVGLELERALSPPFIVGTEYGTRSTTVLLLGADGTARVSEQAHDPLGRPLAIRRFVIQTAR